MRRVASSVWVVALALLVGACKRGKAGESQPTARATTAPSQAPSSVASPVVSAKAPTPERLAPLERARSVVNAWDAALNHHDTEALTLLYAPNVTYYGRHFTREKLIESKRKALSATPGYTQALSGITLDDSDGVIRVTFRKRSGPPKALREVDARLTLERTGDGFAISLESDAPSDLRDDTDRSCIDVAMAVAWALPEVDKVFNAAPPDARIGGLTYPDEDGRVGAAMGFHHDDRFETVFTVDVEDGKLTVSEYGEPLKVPSAGVERVRAKCKKPAG